MHLYNRGSSYYLVVNVPCDLIPIYRKKQIWVSLRTKDKKIANILFCPGFIAKGAYF